MQKNIKATRVIAHKKVRTIATIVSKKLNLLFPEKINTGVEQKNIIAKTPDIICAALLSLFAKALIANNAINEVVAIIPDLFIVTQ
jgi:hypothetical protein